MTAGTILGKPETYTPDNLAALSRDDLALILSESFGWRRRELRFPGGRHRFDRRALLAWISEAMERSA